MESSPVSTTSELWDHTDQVSDLTHGVSEYDLEAYRCDIPSPEIDENGNIVKKPINPLLAAILVFIIGGII